MDCPECEAKFTLHPSKGAPSLNYWRHPVADCKHSGQSYWDVPRTRDFLFPAEDATPAPPEDDMTNLCKIEDVAAEWDVPKSSLRTAAENHGFLVRFGRTLRLERDRLPELLKKCRDQPKEQGSTNSNTANTGTSGTRGNPTAQRAAQAASKLITAKCRDRWPFEAVNPIWMHLGCHLASKTR